MGPCHLHGKTGLPQTLTVVGITRRPRRQGDGETWFPHIFHSVLYAAAPHNAGMKITILERAQPSQTLPAGGLFLGGCSPPKPSRWGGLAAPTGRGMGKPGFPCFHSVAIYAGSVRPGLAQCKRKIRVLGKWNACAPGVTPYLKCEHVGAMLTVSRCASPDLPSHICNRTLPLASRKGRQGRALSGSYLNQFLTSVMTL